MSYTYWITEDKDTILKIGSADPVEINNTYILEKMYNWRGLSIEWNPQLHQLFSISRSNPCLNLDATKVNYLKILSEHNAPTTINYLSVDIDPPNQSFRALVRILKQKKYEFEVITFEHDLYLSRFNILYKYLARVFLKSRGFNLIASNVCNVRSKPQEDWYVNKRIEIKEVFPKNSSYVDFIR